MLNENLAPREKPALADLWGRRKCVLLGKKLSLAFAKENKRGDFDREEKAMRTLDVAWNDRPGTWKATLTDCATGLRAERSFKVAGR